MFKSQNFCHIASNNRNNVKAGMFIYRTTDDLATVTANGYFNDRIIDLNLHDIIVHEQIDNADPTKVKQNFLCVVQKTLTNVNTKIMDTDEVDGADTDLSNLSDTGKANVSAQGTYDSGATYTAGTVGAALQGKASTDLDNLTSAGANIANWSSNMSNCIIEISQDINMTLSSGTLTLKAGSKCYLKTDTATPSITIASDLTTTQTTDGTYFAIYDGSALTTVLTTTYDYSTLPSTYSLPLAILTVSSGSIKSIDQVFNGFGFIGDRIFVLPGVKIAIPKGRNADGTLMSNIETVPTVRTTNQIHTSAYMLNAAGITPAPNIKYTEQTTQPSFANGNWYNPDTNFMYNISSGAVTTSNSMCALYIETTTGSYGGTIVHLTPKLAFRAVDYSETDYISHQSMPSEKYINVTLGASGTAYTAPADGYYTVLKQATGSGEYLFFIDEINTMNLGIYPPAGTNGRCIFPVSKGEVIKVNYTLTGTTVLFRFVYANGAK